MRNFNKRVLAVFISFIVVISIGLGVLFWYITNNYFNTKVQEQLLKTNDAATNSLDFVIEKDYQILAGNVENFKTSTITSFRAYVLANRDVWDIRGLDLVDFGLITASGNLSFDGGNSEIPFGTHMRDAYYYPVTIFSLEDALASSYLLSMGADKVTQKNIYFIIDDEYFFSYNSSNYLDKVLSSTESLPFTYFIINNDLTIYATNHSNQDANEFDVFLKEGNYYLNLASELLDPARRDSVDEVRSFDNRHVFIARHHLPSALLRETTFLIQIYDFSAVSTDTRFLVIMLLSVFLIIILLNAIMTIYTVNKVRKKMNTSEGAKTSYLAQLKTYTIDINNAGVIKGYNQTFLDEFPDVENIKSVRSLEIYSDLSVDIILSSQESFVGAFTKGNLKSYIKFVFVKSMFRTVLVGQDVTSLVADFQVSQLLAYRNPVTGLPNKNSLMKSLTELFAKPDFLDRHNSLIVLNIQKFRNVNQIVGTRIADTIIVDLGKEISASLAENSFNTQLYHTIADNFIVLFENLKSNELVIEWVQKFLDQRKRKRSTTSILDIELKAGVFHLARSEEYNVLTVDDAYESVMEALNAAKDSASNMAVFDSRIGQVANRRKIIERDLIEAVKNEEFIMYLQPQLQISTNKIVGFEALLRWDHPKYINESPFTYISIAESNGLIIDIGKIIIKKTFQLAKELSQYGVCISMNVSPVQILQAGFASQMVDMFKANDLQPGQVSIEITETFLISSFDLIISKIKIIKEQGVAIHLDDFGTGYSSLLYLKELPINTIKIDRGFVQHLENDRYSKSIVSMICNLGKNLGFDIIVEGVERQTQVQILSKYGADIIQGYLISKPVPKEQAIELLEKYNGSGGN